MQLRKAMSGAGLATVVGLVAQGYYAGHRTLPSFTNLDASGAVGPEDGTPITIVALGDSTLTGPGLLDPADIWIRQSLVRIRPDVRVTLVSVAVGGSKAADVRRTQLTAALDTEPDIALVSVGSNDAIRGVPLKRFRADFRFIVQSLVDAGAIVALLGIGNVGAIPRLPGPLAHLLNVRSALFERVHRQTAAGQPHVVKVPIRELASEPFRTRPGMFSPDLFHPSEQGHTVWSDSAQPTLVRLINEVVERRQRCVG